MRFLFLALIVAACAPSLSAPSSLERPAAAFPAPDRPVAEIITSHSGPEAQRDALGEAQKVMDHLGLKPGMVVADIGAGDGYFTSRLARRLAPDGRVIATDVMPFFLDRLKERIAREGHANVDFLVGGADDPRLPAASADVALLVRMYHEIEQPYAFLWRLRDGLKPGGVVAISERDRPTRQHGTPPALLRCELAAVGYREVALHDLGGPNGYLAIFAPTGPRPEPSAIRACRG